MARLNVYRPAEGAGFARRCGREGPAAAKPRRPTDGENRRRLKAALQRWAGARVARWSHPTDSRGTSGWKAALAHRQGESQAAKACTPAVGRRSRCSLVPPCKFTARLSKLNARRLRRFLRGSPEAGGFAPDAAVFGRLWLQSVELVPE